MADFCGGRSAGGRMLHLLTRGFAPVTSDQANQFKRLDNFPDGHCANEGTKEVTTAAA